MSIFNIDNIKFSRVRTKTGVIITTHATCQSCTRKAMKKQHKKEIQIKNIQG